jgi:hypothetical protein
MANDVDMYNDIENYEDDGSTIVLDLCDCYKSRYVEFNERLAEKNKNDFIKKWGFWNNWY